MTHVAYVRHVEVARDHLGDAAPTNSCVRLGMRAWPSELGLPVIASDSVSEWERQARAGHQGWRYVEGTHGIRAGYYGDFREEVLRVPGGDPHPRHVALVEHVDGDRWRGIGAGTPSQKVAYQPQGGGTNTLGVLAGYFIPPTESDHVAPPKVEHAPAVKPPGDDGSTVHKVVKGDTVDKLARQHHTTRQAILKANPPRADRRSADYHIASANLIVIGQRIRIPS